MEDAERKLELTRYLRQEQNLNRMKVKNREDILYGTGKNSEMLYGDDGLELTEYDRIREQGHKGPSVWAAAGSQPDTVCGRYLSG